MDKEGPVSELAPAPWRVKEIPTVSGNNLWTVIDATGDELLCCEKHIAEQICLWRNAEDVMMRRGWGVTKTSKGWIANAEFETCLRLMKAGLVDVPNQSPWEAILAADAWAKEHGL